jgi:cellulose synthase/poly-beta-1,6-N-acetylglucosamine synthase-like glycosyltransferase
VIRDVFLSVLAATGWFVLGYYLLVNGSYVIVHVASLAALRADRYERGWNAVYNRFDSPFLPKIAIVVPAYNEAETIVDSVGSLVDLNYPRTEIVLVNDGSTDDTLPELIGAFDLGRIDADVPVEINAEPVRGVYRSGTVAELVVIDKENGGKGDALNAGIWFADAPLFCALDADSLIDREGLLGAVEPFLRRPDETVATGGTVRVVNGCTVEFNQVTEVTTSNRLITELQEMEYLRAFYSGRLGLSRLRGLVLISGAFGLFRTDLVREIGGYDTDSITKDLALVVRLHRYLLDAEREYHVEFVPEPVVWTQVPEDWSALARQRRRWYRGLIDTLVRERDMIANPQYGRVGIFAMPIFTFAEAIGPLIEGLGYVLVPIAFLLGAVNFPFVVLFFATTVAVGVFLSWFGVLSEVYSFRWYDDPRDVLVLLGHGVLENFGYRQWKALVAWQGLYEYLRGDTEWDEMSRRRFTDAVAGGTNASDGAIGRGAAGNGAKNDRAGGDQTTTDGTTGTETATPTEETEASGGDGSATTAGTLSREREAESVITPMADDETTGTTGDGTAGSTVESDG